MQQAVVTTRSLSVRYLWIDAICIIQDSHNDWSLEADDMANIYLNALLTISATTTSDHTEGFFRPVLQNENLPPRPHSRKSPIYSRGWTFQEQLLSPRILEYSENGISWECIFSVSEGRDDILRFKRALVGFRTTSMALQEQAHTSWQQIVEAYSARHLTHEADKLMAIRGIAKLTGDILQDTFLAGL